MSLRGFADARIAAGEATYYVQQGGAGPPVLLLHGFPQTHICWRHVAPALAVAGHRVLAADLRGYGASTAPPGGPHGEGYTKREMAAELVGVMAEERLVGADPGALIDHAFDTWTSRPEAVDEAARRAYRAALTPGAIAAICADYRAAFHIDRRQDAEDRAAGRRIEVPLLVAVGADEDQLGDAADVWRPWAARLTATRVPGGHFVPEEAPEPLVAALAAFLAGA